MYLNDFQRSDFYRSIGLDARNYDIQVIRKTNESASRVFPIALDVDKPEFFQYLDLCASENRKLIEINNKNNPTIKDSIGKILIYSKLALNITKIYLIKPIESYKINKNIK